jgi:hypothetical protein
LLIFTRSLGWVILISFFAYVLFTQRAKWWREIAIVVAGMVTLVGLVVAITPVELRDLLPTKYAENFADYTFGVEIYATRRKLSYPMFLATAALTHVTADIPSTLLPVGGGVREQGFIEQTGLFILPGLFRLGLVSLLLIGLVRWLQVERVSIFLLSAPVYLAALFLWLWSGSRLLYPVLPQLYFAFLLGIATVAGWMARIVRIAVLPTRRALVGTIALCIAALLIYKSLGIDDSRAHTGDLSARTVWVKENTSESAIIMSGEPVVDYVYGERKTVGFPKVSASVEELGNYLETAHIDYILVTPRLQWRALYSPSYDSTTKQLLDKLKQLAADNQITLVYSTGADLIQVFKTNVMRKSQSSPTDSRFMPN